MGHRNYHFRDQVQAREKRRQLHPVWRGIGCLLLIILAAVGYFVSGWALVQNQVNGWVYLPPELYYPGFLSQWLPPGALLQLAVAFLVMLLGYGILSFGYALAFPIEPGEIDARRPRKLRRRGKWRSRSR
jgi:hypothetical protein